MKGQLNLFDNLGEEVCDYSFITKAEIKQYHWSDSELQNFFQKAIQMVKDCGLNLYDINPIVKMKNFQAWGQCHRKYDTCQIYVSKQLLLTNEHSVMETLLHEVLHAVRGSSGHGYVWQKNAELINRTYGYNIKRVTSSEEKELTLDSKMEAYKYVVRCTGCGLSSGKTRRSRLIDHPEWFYCTKCNGRIERIK